MELRSFCRELQERSLDRPDEVFLVQAESGEELQYGEVWAQALLWTAWFRSRGVEAGDRVATVLRTDIDTVPMTVGVALSGAIEVPLNIQYREPQFAYALDDADPAIVIADEEFTELVS